MPMNYTTLIGAKTVEGSIKYAVRHSEVPSEFVLTNAEGLIYSMLRVREMKALQTGTIADGDTTLALPTNFVGSISLGIAGEYKQPIDILDEEHFEQRLAQEADGSLYEGTPRFCVMDGTHFRFDVEADRAYLYRLWYYKQPVALSGSNETNFLTTRFPHILDAACKFYAYAHREDNDMAEKWKSIAIDAITLANANHDQELQALRFENRWR